jgi:SAM-dependent methyltransferase
MLRESENLDDPERIEELRARIRSKIPLRRWYEECYDRYQACLERCPSEGIALEIGAGASFAPERVPGLVTSDLLPYDGVDQVADAMALPFEDASLRAILMQNVFHHIPDVGAFLAEAQRTLVPGGRVLMIEPHPGWLATPFWTHLHHETFDPQATSWRFDSRGPLSDANGALPWIVFQRDRARFEDEFPGLEVASYRVHTALRYFLVGGLKTWSLIPSRGFALATRVDAFLSAHCPKMGSFVDIELVHRPSPVG